MPGKLLCKESQLLACDLHFLNIFYFHFDKKYTKNKWHSLNRIQPYDTIRLGKQPHKLSLRLLSALLLLSSPSNLCEVVRSRPVPTPCSYMWRKLHRAAIRGGPIDGYIADTRHTVHCGHELVEERGENISLQEINTIIMVKTPTCMFYV